MFPARLSDPLPIVHDSTPLLQVLRRADPGEAANLLLRKSLETSRPLTETIAEYLRDEPRNDRSVRFLEALAQQGFWVSRLHSGQVTVSFGSPASVDPEVTVVVPAYNAAEFLEHTLDSIEAQTLREFECIVVDDGSTDETSSIALTFARRDPRFRMVEHRANAGLAAARNSGLRVARARHVCFLDADDLMMNDSLQLRVAALKMAESDLVIGVYCGSLTIPETARKAPHSTETSLQPVNFLTAAGNCPFNANQPLFFTKTLRAFGGFDESLKQAEDYELWMRILRAGFTFAPANRVAVTYRIRDTSMIRQNPLHHLETSSRWFRAAHAPTVPGLFQEPGRVADYDRPWVHYHSQLVFFNRVFAFAGMALAAGEEKERILNAVLSELPDAHLLLRYRNGFEHLKTGVSRYLSRKAMQASIEKIDLDCRNLVTAIEAGAARVALIRPAGLAPERIDATELVRRPDLQSRVEIVFLPHNAYHVWTISLLASHLEASGVTFCVVDLSRHYRDEGVSQRAAELKLPLLGASNFLLGHYCPRLLVSFNDWDPIVRSIMVMAQRAGAHTVAIVEGIQDYLDADTGRLREAYRTADTVFLPGPFDTRYFQETEQNVLVGGLSRIHTLRQAPRSAPPTERVALINSNFSYSVLVDRRDDWVRQAVQAAIDAGYRPVITRHPADQGTVHADLETSLAFYEAVEASSVVICRFASGILEVLAMGRPVIYFNPHGEKVDKFKDPMEAYPIAETVQDLALELIKIPATGSQFLARADAFLAAHAGLGARDPSAVTAEALAGLLASRSETTFDAERFRRELAMLDRQTRAFTDLGPLRDMIRATYGTERAQLSSVLGGDPAELFLTQGIDVDWEKLVAVSGEPEQVVAKHPPRLGSRVSLSRIGTEALRKTGLKELPRVMRRRPFISAFAVVVGMALVILIVCWPLLSAISTVELLVTLMGANLVLTAIVARIVRKSLTSRINNLDRRPATAP